VRGLNNVSASLMRLMRTSKSGSGCATDADLVEMRVQSSGTLINMQCFGMKCKSEAVSQHKKNL